MTPPPGLLTPTGSEADYVGPFEAFIQQIRDGFDKAVQAFQDIIDQVNKWAWTMGLATWWMVKNAIDSCVEGLKRLAQFVKQALEHHTPVVSLMIASFRWTGKVKGPVSNLSIKTTRYANDNLYNWSGAAANAYNDKAGLMQGAVDECAARSEFIAGWLFTVTKSNVEYAKTLATIVTFVVGKLVEGASEAGTVIGIPFVCETLGECAGALTEKALNVLMEIGSRLVDALGDVRDIQGSLKDNSRLPNGAWPQVVTG
jgi:hypothetical protein